MGRISTYLNVLKDRNNVTQQQLADMTGIPVGTLPRYFGNLDDDSASFEVVRKLVTTMHGSLDELAGIYPSQQQHDESAYMAVVAGLEARLDEKDDRIKHRAELLDHEQERSDRSIERETRRANRATLAACIIGALFIIFIFIDIFWPTRGWIIR